MIIDYPFVEEEFETIRTIIRRKASIARFGYGEMNLVFDKAQIMQPPDPRLCKMLREILFTEDEKLLVGLPRIIGRLDLIYNDPPKINFWDKKKRKWLDCFKMDKKYYSAFISRPDSAPHINCDDYWNLCKEIWRDRNLVLVQGLKYLHADNDLFKTAKKVDMIFGPRRQAFMQYDEIIEQVCNYDKDSVVYIALGPAGTALAYGLHKLGYQALDMGHHGGYYAGRFKGIPRARQDMARIEAPEKYNG